MAFAATEAGGCFIYEGTILWHLPLQKQVGVLYMKGLFYGIYRYRSRWVFYI